MLRVFCICFANVSSILVAPKQADAHQQGLGGLGLRMASAARP